MANMIKCPFCEKMADSAKENCPHCGGPMGFEYKPDASHTPTVVKQYEALGGSNPPPSSASSASAGACPSCGAKTKANDIICLQCGTNLLVKNQAKVEIIRRSSNSSSNTKVFAAAAAVLILAGIGGLAGYFLFGDPVEKAKALANAGNSLEAINVINAHLENNPDDANAQLVLGKLLWKTQQYPQAADAFEQVTQLNPANTDAAMMAVSSLAKDSINPQTGRQTEILEKVCQNEAGNLEAWKLLALARGVMGDYSGQLKALEKAQGSATELSPDLALFKSIAQALSGNARAALNTIDTSTVIEQRDSITGMLAFMAGQRERALSALGKASAEGVDTKAAVITRLGLLRLAEGDVATAHEHFMKAAQMPGAPGAAAFFDAFCLQARGMDEEAIIAYNNVIDLQPEFAQEAAMQLALLHLRKNNPDQANNSLKHARQLGEENAKLLTLEGQVFLMNNAMEEARERFQSAMKLDPTYPAAHLEYGLMYIAGGNLEQGLLELERFLTLARSDKPLPQVNEIELLIQQLKGSTGQSSAVARVPGATE